MPYATASTHACPCHQEFYWFRLSARVSEMLLVAARDFRAREIPWWNLRPSSGYWREATRDAASKMRHRFRSAWCPLLRDASATPRAGSADFTADTLKWRRLTRRQWARNELLKPLSNFSAELIRLILANMALWIYFEFRVSGLELRVIDYF